MDAQDLYRRQTAILTCIFLALAFLLWWATSWKVFLRVFSWVERPVCTMSST